MSIEITDKSIIIYYRVWVCVQINIPYTSVCLPVFRSQLPRQQESTHTCVRTHEIGHARARLPHVLSRNSYSGQQMASFTRTLPVTCLNRLWGGNTQDIEYQAAQRPSIAFARDHAPAAFISLCSPVPPWRPMCPLLKLNGDRRCSLPTQRRSEARQMGVGVKAVSGMAFDPCFLSKLTG